MANENYMDIQCPVCGYYCLGKGGIGCIDKPNMQKGKPMNNTQETRGEMNMALEGLISGIRDTYLHNTMGVDVAIGAVRRAFEIGQKSTHRNQAQTDWMSVKERLPEENVFVLTLDKKGGVAIYRLVSYGTSPITTAWNMRDADGINSPPNNYEITHWQPLPSPPSTEVGE